MGNESLLLRMLEPIVPPHQRAVAPPSARSTDARGVQEGGEGRIQGRGPIESRSFESLLQEAREMNQLDPDATPPPSDTPGADVKDTEPAAAAFSPLLGYDRIENPSLREMLSQAAVRTQPDTMPDQSQQPE